MSVPPGRAFVPGILAQCHLVFAGGSQVFDSIETTCEMENSKEPRMAVPRGTGILAGVGFQWRSFSATC
jgi:hypothetical protein